MTLDQLNELINRGYIGFALMIFAFAFLLYASKKDAKSSGKRK